MANNNNDDHYNNNIIIQNMDRRCLAYCHLFFSKSSGLKRLFLSYSQKFLLDPLGKCLSFLSEIQDMNTVNTCLFSKLDIEKNVWDTDTI